MSVPTGTEVQPHVATVDIMRPGSAMVIVNGKSAHVWRSESGRYIVTIDGDDIPGSVKAYIDAVVKVSQEYGFFGDVAVESTNESTNKVTNYIVEVPEPKRTGDM